MLEFTDNPLQIRKMEITDATGNLSQVQLENTKFGMPLDDKLFTFEDPRGIGRRDRK